MIFFFRSFSCGMYSLTVQLFHCTLVKAEDIYVCAVILQDTSSALCRFTTTHGHCCIIIILLVRGNLTGSSLQTIQFQLKIIIFQIAVNSVIILRGLSSLNMLRDILFFKRHMSTSAKYSESGRSQLYIATSRWNSRDIGSFL